MSKKPRIVVAGGAGFIGTALVSRLRNWGYDHLVLDSKKSKVTDRSIPIDLKDCKRTADYLNQGDICVCLAAKSAGIGFFNTHPAEMLDENTRIISSLFNAASEKRIDRIVYISSSCVFDDVGVQPITEASLMRARPPAAGYPFSKLVGEYYCRAFFQQYGLPYTIIRPFNVYGPGEEIIPDPGENHVIPALTKKLLDGENPLQIFGDGHQTRSFTYVDDMADGIISAIECRERALNEDCNLASSEEISILLLAAKLWKLIGATKDPPRFECLKPYVVDAQRRAADTSKAARVLGWVPKTSLDDGLQRFLRWAGRSV